jgi:hypothetical protein
LRAIRSNTNTDADSNSNSVTHSYSNVYSNTDTDAMHRKMCANAEAAPDASAATVVVR